MEDFKIGDHVTINDVRYAFGCDENGEDSWLEGKDGRIKEIREDGYMEVQLDNYDVNVYVLSDGLELIT